jgi:hypothetical protein
MPKEIKPENIKFKKECTITDMGKGLKIKNKKKCWFIPNEMKNDVMEVKE